MPMQSPATLNRVEQSPMMQAAVSTGCNLMPCRHAKEMPTASASMLVATERTTMPTGVSSLAAVALSFCLMPSHSIFIPR